MVIRTVKGKQMTYKIQIDDVVRDATDEEIAEIEARKAETLAQNQFIEEKVSARAALLERLGITADEVALLLG
jgi:DNA-binding protein YbaB